MAGTAETPAHRRILEAGLVVAALSFASIVLTRGSGHVPALWPANAVLMVMLFRAPAPLWPAMIGTGLAATAAARLLAGDGPLLAFGLAAAGSLEVGLGVLAARRFLTNGILRLYRVQDWLWCVVTVTIAAPALSASVAAALLAWQEGQPFAPHWRLWFAANALGLILLLPLLINLRLKDLAGLFGPPRLRQAVAILLLVGMLTTLAFQLSWLPVLFLIPPSLILAVFVLGSGGAMLSAFLAGAIALLFTVGGSGPIAALEPGTAERVLLVQIFIAIGAFTTQPIAVTLAMRDRLLQDMSGAREAAERANANLNLAETIAQVGHWFLRERADGTVEDRWSEGLLRIFGLPADARALGGEALLAMIHPDDRAGHYGRVRAAVDDGRQYEFRVRRPDGAVRHVAMRGISEAGPAPYRRTSVGVILDVTDMRQAGVSLAASESRYRVLADNATDMIMLMDADMRPIYVSPAARAITGYEMADIPAFQINSVVHPDDRAHYRAARASLLEGGSRAAVVFRFRHKDGGWKWLEALINRVSGETPSGAAFVTTVRDVTQRQEDRAALEEAMRKAEEASRVKSSFLANMSHEIRTPMNSVIGFSELLLDSPLTDEQRGHVDMVLEAGKSLLVLLNDILDISKIEAGKLELETIAYAPRAVIEEAVALVRRQAVDKGIQLTVDAAADVPPWALGDPTRLRQILLNLLSNALKFTLDGSVTVRLRRDAGRLRFAVIDTGIGIASESQALLFQDFSQADRSTTRRFGGTGLGLALCKRLAEGMGGEIGASSTPGIGSEFWFALPLVEPAVLPAPVGRVSTGPVAPAGRARILVAEDMLPNQILVAEILRASGHEVEVASNGAEAVAAVRRARFDLILMDVEMPEMDGLDATRTIRTLPGGNMAIVALTAGAMPEQQARCRAAGMDDFVAKPCNRTALLDIVGRWASPAAPDAPDRRRAVDSAVLT